MVEKSKNNVFTVTISLDVFFECYYSRSINKIPGQIPLNDGTENVLVLQWGAKRLLRALARWSKGNTGNEIRQIILYSPYFGRVGGRILSTLRKESGKGIFFDTFPRSIVNGLSSPGAYEGEESASHDAVDGGMIFRGKVGELKGISPRRKKDDERTTRALSRLGVRLGRSVFLTRSTRLLQRPDIFSGVEINVARSAQEVITRHLSRVQRLSGNLDGKDLEVYNEDHEPKERQRLIKWASRLILPEDLKASSGKERVLCLDLDETLIHTDKWPRSKEGQEKMNRALAIFGFPVEPAGQVKIEVERHHDFVLGDYGGWVRPGVIELLKTAHEIFDRVFIYTAATKDYAEEILKRILPPEIMPHGLLHRAHTSSERRDGDRLKSVTLLEALGYKKNRVLFVDDRPEVYRFSRKNVIGIKPYYGPSTGAAGKEKNSKREDTDVALNELTELLKKLADIKDFTRAKFSKSLGFSPKKNR